MARLSKAQHFEVYEDSRSSSPQKRSDMSPRPSLPRNDSKFEPDHPEDPDFQTVNEDSDCDASSTTSSHRRRESNFTTISSMPSTLHPSAEFSPPYTPPQSQPRPTFRRAESVRRMQMTSPTPFDRSPRRSVLLSRSRPGTPRSARSYKSPRSRKAFIPEEEDEGYLEPQHLPQPQIQEEEDERRDHPLVLLHLTLLPVDLPWSAETMSSALPAKTQENLQVLRAQVSETVLQRGILIPHPREDYGLLEERLLEALELRGERITKCGHFVDGETATSDPAACHGRGQSTSSVDSGHGESLSGEEEEEDEEEETMVMERQRRPRDGCCETCARRVATSKGGVVGSGGQRWTVKVFAANGLMRAAAWAAAWPEMERVDVEILPWIGDELRAKLDAAAAEEERMRKRRAEEEREHEAARTVGEIMWREDGQEGDHDAVEREGRQRQAEFAADMLARMVSVSGQYHRVASGSHASVVHHDEPSVAAAKVPSDLPPIYRPSEIPLSLLLRNYVFLLAQDTRNVAILALTIIAMWLSIQSAFVSAPSAVLAPPLEVCPNVDTPKVVFDASPQMMPPVEMATANVSQVAEVHNKDSESQQIVDEIASPEVEPDYSEST